MSISQDTLTECLVRENEEYRCLQEKHRSFEERLERLNARHILSDEEKEETMTLKKHKLALKDRMAEIVREFARNAPGRASH